MFLKSQESVKITKQTQTKKSVAPKSDDDALVTTKPPAKKMLKDPLTASSSAIMAENSAASIISDPFITLDMDNAIRQRNELEKWRRSFEPT